MPIRYVQPILAAAVVSVAGLAHAQRAPEVIIEIDQPVLEPGDSTIVRLLAGFDGRRDYAIAGVATNLLVDAGVVDPTSAWSDPRVVAPMAGPGTSAGVPDAGGYSGIIASQLNFPTSIGYADPMNPIPFWEITFTAPLDMGAFDMDLSTRTTKFDVYIAMESSISETRLFELVEGSGRITVVPAPAGGLVFFSLLATRRRSCRRSA